MGFNPWVLHNDFSLEEAVILSLGSNPDEGWIPKGYDTLLIAMKNAIKSGELKAIFRGRNGKTIDALDVSTIRMIGSDSGGWKKMRVCKGAVSEWFESAGVQTDFFVRSGNQSKDHTSEDNIKDKSYMTPKMQLMSDAVFHFWQGVDPLDKHAPTNENVEDWLTEEAKKRELQWSKRISESVATIIRHPDKP